MQVHEANGSQGTVTYKDRVRKRKQEKERAREMTHGVFYRILSRVFSYLSSIAAEYDRVRTEESKRYRKCAR